MPGLKKIAVRLFWFLATFAGAWAYVNLALPHGEPINSANLLIAAVCTYAIGYRFYSKWIAAKILALNDLRATPASCTMTGATL